MPTQDAVPEILCTSRALGWRGLLLETYFYAGGEFQHPPSEDHILCLNLGVPLSLEQGESMGHVRRMQMPTGFAMIIPAGQPSAGHHADPVHHLHLHLASGLLSQVAAQIAPGFAETLRGMSSAPFHDPHVEQITHLLRLEAESGAPQGGLYAETLALALSVRLLQREHDTVRLPILPPAARVRTELQRAVAFIQDNLASELSLDAIAREAGLSSYHFARLFAEAFGVAPHQYVIQARIERAKTLITQRRLPLGEAAHSVGFSDQSHFTRHFKRLVGVTPRAFVRDTTS